jgi:NCAIR mutase (PurE)-related protein
MPNDEPTAHLGFARVDLDRERRTGDPEVVYAAGKTPEQVVAILRRLHQAHPTRAVLATRVSVEAAAAVSTELPTAVHDIEAGAVTLGPPTSRSPPRRPWPLESTGPRSSGSPMSVSPGSIA